MANTDFESIEELYKKVLNNPTAKEVTEALTTFAAAFSYQGFDPIHLSDLFKKKCSALKLNVSQMATLAVGIIVYRGTKISKMEGKSTDSLKKAIGQLRQILTTKSGQQLGRNDITLPRIAACYPELSARVAHAANKITVPGYDDVPSLVRSHFFAAVCPVSESAVALAKINMLWLIDFDKLVRPRDPTPPAKQVAFWRAQNGSQLISNSDRVKLLNDLGITRGTTAEMIKRFEPKFGPMLSVEFAPIVVKPVVLEGMGIKSSIPDDSPGKTPSKPSSVSGRS